MLVDLNATKLIENSFILKLVKNVNSGHYNDLTKNRTVNSLLTSLRTIHRRTHTPTDTIDLCYGTNDRSIIGVANETIASINTVYSKKYKNVFQFTCDDLITGVTYRYAKHNNEIGLFLPKKEAYNPNFISVKHLIGELSKYCCFKDSKIKQFIHTYLTTRMIFDPKNKEIAKDLTTIIRSLSSNLINVKVDNVTFKKAPSKKKLLIEYNEKGLTKDVCLALIYMLYIELAHTYGEEALFTHKYWSEQTLPILDY